MVDESTFTNLRYTFGVGFAYRIVETVAGKPDWEFWKHICKPQSMYGGEVITGWLAELIQILERFDGGTLFTSN